MDYLKSDYMWERNMQFKSEMQYNYRFRGWSWDLINSEGGSVWICEGLRVKDTGENGMELLCL